MREPKPSKAIRESKSGLQKPFPSTVRRFRRQDHLYENLELGVDLDSRIALVGSGMVGVRRVGVIYLGAKARGL